MLGGGINADLGSALSDAEERYRQHNPRSLERHEEARKSLPGGNTRAVLWYQPFPLSFASGDGCRVTDLDGHTYVDLISEYSAGLYGHSEPAIREALGTAIADGLLLGAPNLYEARYARAICDRFPAIERVRFCNSGTESNIMALSVARAVTGRNKILAFRDGYHGGVLTFAHGGSPLNVPFDFVFADYNDMEGTAELIGTLSDDLAAVIVEPMLGGGGCIPADVAFLQMLRERTAEAGALLIFDEVMTSRLNYRGLHGRYGINPDLVTLGKYLGGGASFGAFGGRADLMDRFDPSSEGSFSHGGTFNNNVLSMASGHAAFSKVLTEDASRRVNERGDRLRSAMNEALETHQIEGIVVGLGSLMNLHFVRGPVTNPEQVDHAEPRLLQLWHMEMVLRGFYVAPRGMIALSLPFGDQEASAFISAFDDFLVTNKSVLPKRT